MKKSIALAAAFIFLSLSSISIGAMMDDMMDHMEGGGEGAKKEAVKKADETSGALTQESEAEGVTVKVSYLNPSDPKGPSFTITLDTHSVDLDRYRMDEITVLRDDAGKEYAPVVSSESASGHHRKGVVTFPDADISTSRSVTLVIKGVAGVPERVFLFELPGGK